jgi:hypothetical protein
VASAAGYAACHTWLGGLAQGLDGNTARDCTVASLVHDLGALGFRAGLAAAGTCAVILRRRFRPGGPGA